MRRSIPKAISGASARTGRRDSTQPVAGSSFSLERASVIRSIEPRDIDAWGELRARLWPHANPHELAEEARDFGAGSVVTGITAVFIAEDDAAAPIGFLELSVRAFSDGCDSMPVPHVEGWYVEPHARGKGVGRSLIDRAERWARAHEFTELASDTEIDNLASLRAHTRCGFDEAERLIKFRKSLG
jgi:aminoglycoside 6'-N-acetyltransferase I